MRPADAPQTLTVIDASTKGIISDFSEIWRFREVLLILVWRDLKVRYRQTYFGLLWAVVQPLIAMSVFSIFLGSLIGLPSAQAPYPLFVLAGLVPWNFFSRAVSGMTGSLVGNQELVSRIYLPRMIIPLSAMLSSAVDVLWGLLIIAAAMIYFGIAVSPAIFLLPVWLILLASAATGIGLTLAAINVKYRDFGFVVPFLLQMLLFMSPVLYSTSIIPEDWRLLYSINPMVGTAETIRWSLIGTPANWEMIAISSCSAISLLVLGLFVYSRLEHSFSDVI